jgi:hypothetical protein
MKEKRAKDCYQPGSYQAERNELHSAHRSVPLKASRARLNAR